MADTDVKKREQTSQGFTLIITLVMVALAAILVVGLLISASFDRLTAVSYDQRFQAELAAQSGLEAAKQALFALPSSGSKPRTRNDDFIVVSAMDANTPSVPYYFIGCVEDPTDTGVTDYQNPAIRYYPLFSGGAMSSPLNIASGVAPPPIPPPSPAPSTVASQTFSSGGTPTYYPKLFPSPAPHTTWQPNIRTQWQYIPSPTPGPSPSASPMQYRYTYWIEDMAGYLDANVAGNVDDKSTVTTGVHIRTLGYDPREIALFTLFPPRAGSPPTATGTPGMNVDDGSTYATALIGSHPLLFTRLTTRVEPTIGAIDDTVCAASLTGNLQTDFEQSIIPFGMGHKNQGRLKTNLNQLLSDIASKERTADAAIDGAVPAPAPPSATPAASPIVPTIIDNLPNFASARQGALSSSSEGYLETIAANIIDYGDSDNTPTMGTNSATGKHYRGIDLMPFVTEVYEMYYWKRDYYQQTPPSSDYFVDIEVKTYAQLWNMFNQDITSGTLTFTDTLTAGLKFGTTGPNSSFDKGVKSSPNNVSMTFSTSSSLKSNEYRPVLASDITYTIDIGSNVKPSGSIYISDHSAPTNGNTDQDSSYVVVWNGVSYDRPGLKAGSHLAIERDVCSLSAPGAVDITGTIPGLRYTKTSGNAPYVLGDPRMSFYLNGTQYSSSYAGNSAWGGAVYMKTNVETNGWVAGESRVNGWADGGHNSTRGKTPTTNPTLLSQDPTTVNPSPPIDSTKAPARISNRTDNRIYSITELSYVYDPFQWNPFATTPTTTTAVDAGWQNTWKNKFKNFPTPKTGDDDTYGSHSTFRIGRPEHKSFDQPGTRAWQLMDIFSVGDPANTGPSGGTSTQISTRGKININTAGQEVLRTLGAGIKIGNLNTGDVDQAIQPSTVYGPMTTNGTAADIFAANVITQRQKQPFISTSQLAALPGSNGEPFFGNPDQWPNNGPIEWNDAASEQYFAKVYNFTTVRSRNFRVFVTGQYIDPNSNDPYTGQPPRVIATANKIYEVFLKPTRNSTGAITDQTCVVTYQADAQ